MITFSHTILGLLALESICTIHDIDYSSIELQSRIYTPSITFEIGRDDIDNTTSDASDVNNHSHTYTWDDSYKLYDVTVDGAVISYILMYPNGNYVILNKEERAELIHSRIQQGTSANNASPDVVNSNTFANILMQIKYDSYEDEDQARYELYNTVTSMALFENFPNVTPEHMKSFVYNDQLWHWFKHGNDYYKISPYQYELFVTNTVTNIYTDPSTNDGFGSGLLTLSLNLSESVQIKNDDFTTAESIIVKILSSAGDEYIYVINPPTYICYVDLDNGDYFIDSVTSFEYPDYPLLCEKTYFTITENSDTNIDLYVYRPQDEIAGSEYTSAQITQTIEEGEVEFREYTESQSANSISSTVSENQVNESAKKKSKFLSILIAILTLTGIIYVAIRLIQKD